MYFDPMYFVFSMPAFLFAMYAQWKVSSTFGKYQNVNSSGGFTGEQIARRLLDAEGLFGVTIEATPGELTDHYDPRTKVVRLSESTMYRTSVAAVGVVAHEVGHAIEAGKRTDAQNEILACVSKYAKIRRAKIEERNAWAHALKIAKK